MVSSKRRDATSLVLSVLERYGECNLNTLRRETGLNYYSLVRLLEELVTRGLVVEKRVGRLRMFKLAGSQRRS